MLQTSHNSNEYAKPILASTAARPRTYEGVYRAMGTTHASRQASVEQGRGIGDSGEMTFDEFIERYLDVRDQLAYRRLKGDALSRREQVLLTMLNQLVDRLLPPPAPLPAHINDLVDEVLRKRPR